VAAAPVERRSVADRAARFQRRAAGGVASGRNPSAPFVVVRQR